MSLNRIANIGNRFQGEYKKVLCVCAAGLLRAPTAAWVLSNEPFNFNTRAVGISKEFALIPIDDALVLWADEIVVMDEEHVENIREHAPEKRIICLDIPDEYSYRDPELIELIKNRYQKISNSNE